ncbi:MAG: hypothetical protein WCI93_01715 [bacterium]
MKENFLENKYKDLPGLKPVSRAVEQAKKDPKRKFAPHSRDERIEAYLSRIDKVVEDERGWELFKNKIIKDLVIDINDKDSLAKIATGLYEAEKRIAIDQGRKIQLEANPGLIKGYENLAKEKREIQVKSLNYWLDYLKQNDAKYPTWFRYFVVRNLSKMGTLDKKKGEYSERKKHTISPFPEINSEALGFVYRMLTTGVGNQEFTEENQKEKRIELEKTIEKKDFIKLYTFAQIETAGALNRESLKGEWVKYDKGSDYHILENALRGKGTGWCTAEGSAPSQLKDGDFYVYYTKGSSGNYSEPRIAIRMEDDEVAEVRGVNHRQELEPVLLDTAQEKYHSLPGGQKFDKKSSDMKKVTELVKKQEKSEKFSKEDLEFIYQMKSSIEGFGYKKDPRIVELLKERNSKEDVSIIFGCEPSQIAWNKGEINENTKVYIGEWNPEISKKIPENVLHLYESLPGKKILRTTIELSIKSSEEYTKELTKQGFQIHPSAQDMLNKLEPLKQKEKIDLVSFSLEQIGLSLKQSGFSNSTTLQQVYAKAKELGLELCPPQVGPELRLNYKDQPMGEWLRIAMDSISNHRDRPMIFTVESPGLLLGCERGEPESMFMSHMRFVFRSRKN